MYVRIGRGLIYETRASLPIRGLEYSMVMIGRPISYPVPGPLLRTGHQEMPRVRSGTLTASHAIVRYLPYGLAYMRIDYNQ